MCYIEPSPQKSPQRGNSVSGLKSNSYHQSRHDRAVDDIKQMSLHTQPAAGKKVETSIQMHFIYKYVNLKTAIILTCH